ncbi:hypothetical protein GE09DRAFT_1256537 [Coniochaeta sp. 2T2.1]|nr:hypothetical protein GE09DRAFT_1256537 [Coniochaeta sp. 2T2.1]
MPSDFEVKIDKLKGESNLQNWKKVVLLQLGIYGLQKYVTTDIEKTEDNLGDRYKVTLLLQASLSDDVQTRLINGGSKTDETDPDPKKLYDDIFIIIPAASENAIAELKIAIDCEMMRSNIGQVLGRVSVVNNESQTIFDTFVCYPKPISVTNTDEKYSGIGWNDIDPKNGAQPFPEVQAQLIELLRGRIVIGHDIQKDLKVISMDLPSHVLRLQGVARLATSITFDMIARDTQKYSGYRRYAIHGAHQGPSLKNLALEVLGRPIKQGRVSSVEDAVATMEVYRNAEIDIDREQAVRLDL